MEFQDLLFNSRHLTFPSRYSLAKPSFSLLIVKKNPKTKPKTNQTQKTQTIFNRVFSLTFGTYLCGLAVGCESNFCKRIRKSSAVSSNEPPGLIHVSSQLEEVQGCIMAEKTEKTSAPWTVQHTGRGADSPAALQPGSDKGNCCWCCLTKEAPETLRSCAKHLNSLEINYVGLYCRAIECQFLLAIFIICHHSYVLGILCLIRKTEGCILYKETDSWDKK